MSQKRKKFTEEFRREAVNLLISSGKSIAEVASELGIELYNLSRWKNQFLGKKNNSEAEMIDPVEKLRKLEQENNHMVKEIIILKQERDILKKAMGIVSKQ